MIGKITRVFSVCTILASTVLWLLLAGCMPQTVIPITATNTLAPTVTATNGKKPTPVPSATAPVPFAWIGQQTLLFQPGDLPEGIGATGFNNEIPEVMKDKYGAAPDGAATLQLINSATQGIYGNTSLYLFKNPAVLNDVAQKLVQAEEARRQGLPQPGIGSQAFLFLPEQPGFDMALFFSTCRAFVQIRLFSADQPTILQYANRLVGRLNQVDCQGQATVPIQTPPTPLKTTTTQSSSPVSQGFTPIVARLPDPDGADTIRSYFFLNQQHGWLALGAYILATVDGGQTWQPRSTAPAQVEALSFQSFVDSWMQTTGGFYATNDGGSTWTPSNQPTQTYSVGCFSAYHEDRPIMKQHMPSARNAMPSWQVPSLPSMPLLLGLSAPVAP